mmetsp:Transcript_42599/g.84306  ORF Transcript_42599/g.84306 Transcript_42599/m.84306 type:complete len:116 (+) Transcript_42599:253-600(+)
MVCTAKERTSWSAWMVLHADHQIDHVLEEGSQTFAEVPGRAWAVRRRALCGSWPVGAQNLHEAQETLAEGLLPKAQVSTCGHRRGGSHRQSFSPIWARATPVVVQPMLGDHCFLP